MGTLSFIAVGPDGRVALADEAAAELFACPAHELVDRPLADLLSAPDHTGETPTTTFRRPDGTVFTATVTRGTATTTAGPCTTLALRTGASVGAAQSWSAAIVR